MSTDRACRYLFFAVRRLLGGQYLTLSRLDVPSAHLMVRTIFIALVLVTCVTNASAGSGVLVERVVAVIAGKPLLLSELRKRAAPMRARQPDASATTLRSYYQALLVQLIDERLIAREASRRHLRVTPSEVDAALAEIAAKEDKTVEEVLDEAQRSSRIEPAAYRADLWRQILGIKLLSAVVGSDGPKEQRARAAYLLKRKRDLLRRLRKRYGVQVRVRFQ